MRIIMIVTLASLMVPGLPTASASKPCTAGKLMLTQEEASHFAKLALKCVRQEYPNKLDHTMNGPADVAGPRALHPAFYGCFDWHSCVHGHWMLARLLRLFPNLPEAAEIRAALNENLTAANIKAETAYLSQPNTQSFERTYGWAWLLKLAEELHSSTDPDERKWSADLQPLAEAFATRYVNFLPKQTYPIRTGVHPNTAFGMAFAFDYAKATGNHQLIKTITDRSMAYYGADVNYPAAWEPGGEDFLSPALEEADLMRRVMAPGDFANWFHKFLPDISKGEPKSLLTPAIVGDRTDPKIVHLDGLNLSRAWCLMSVAAALPADDPDVTVLANAAGPHARASLGHVASGDYVGEHWLATFAVYMLSVASEQR